MRFRFCGDLDAPDWLLAEIATVSRMSSVRLKILVRQIIIFMVQGNIDYEKVLKLVGDSMSDISDLKGAIAAILFMTKNAAKFDVDEYTFLQEIQQLGLPKENAEAISKQYRDGKDAIQASLYNSSYRMNRVLGTEWRIDRVIGSSDANDSIGTSAHVKFTVDSRPQEGPLASEEAGAKRLVELAYIMSAEKLQVLLHELQQARRTMDSLEG